MTAKKSIREYADEAFEEKLGKAVDHCMLSFAHEVEATGGGISQSQVEALAEAVYHIYEPVRDVHNRVARIELLLVFLSAHMQAFERTLPYLKTETADAEPDDSQADERLAKNPRSGDS